MQVVARWCVTHRLVVVGAMAAGAGGHLPRQLGHRQQLRSEHDPVRYAERRRGDLLQRAAPAQSGDTEQIVFQVKAGTVDNPAVRTQLTAMLGQVSTLPYVASVTSPYTAGGHGRSARARPSPSPR